MLISYLPLKMAQEGTSMDLKLIEVYYGKQDVVEWLSKVELVYGMRKITDLALVFPLRLTVVVVVGRAF